MSEKHWERNGKFVGEQCKGDARATREFRDSTLGEPLRSSGQTMGEQ